MMLNYIRKYIWAHLPKRITRKQCLREAVIWGGALIALGFLMHWRGKIDAGARGGFVIAGVALATALVIPGLGERVYLAILRVFAVIGWALGRVILTVTFYLIVTPLALIMAAVGKNPIKRQFKAGPPPQWRAHEEPEDRRRYYRQT